MKISEPTSLDTFGVWKNCKWKMDKVANATLDQFTEH